MPTKRVKIRKWFSNVKIGYEQKTFLSSTAVLEDADLDFSLVGFFWWRQLFRFLPLCVFHGENELFAQI